MDDIEAAWVAGLLEGEGAFLISYTHRSSKGPYPMLRAQMNQTDEDVVRKLGRIAGGRVRGPYENTGEGNKPVWRWELGTRAELLELLAAIRPHMGSRRGARIDEMFTVHETTARPKWRHGTRQGYEVHHCHCRECRDANALRHRERRARIRAEA